MDGYGLTSSELRTVGHSKSIFIFPLAWLRDGWMDRSFDKSAQLADLLAVFVLLYSCA